MKSRNRRHIGRLSLSAALWMSLSCPSAAAPIARFPYLPGGGIIQIGQGGGHLFAVEGTPVWIDLNVGGYYLYSRNADSSSWKLVRRSPPSAILPRHEGPIRFQGTFGSRSFFTLEDGKAYFTDNGGATFTRVADKPFLSNVAAIGSLAFAILNDTVHTSADSGLSWTASATKLVAEELVSLGTELYAANSYIWRSGDSGRTWQDSRAGMESAVGFNMLYGIHRYDSLLVASSGQGTFARSAASAAWSPMGTGNSGTRRVFSFGSELIGQAAQNGPRLHRYDPVLSAWQEYRPWGSGKPMGDINFGSICCVESFGTRWIVGNENGIRAYDPAAEDYAWFDAGLHRAPYARYGAISGALVAVHRWQLFAVPADGIPAVLRDSRKPGAPIGDLSLISIEPADSILWAQTGSTLLRLENSAGIPTIRDSVRVDSGKWFGHGRDLIGIIRIKDPLSGQATDSVSVRVSRDAGATFKELSPRLRVLDAAPFSDLASIVAAYIWNDSVWVWDADRIASDANYHAIDLASGGRRFGETTLPHYTPVGNTLYPVQALHIERGMVAKQGGNIWYSEDGGLTWTLTSQGIPESKAEGSRIQKHSGRLYLTAGDTLYHAAESDLQWSGVDLKGPAEASGGVMGAMVAREGVYVQKGAEDVVLIPWSSVPASAHPLAAKPSPIRKGRPPAFHRGKGMIFLRNGVGYSIEGRAIP